MGFWTSGTRSGTGPPDAPAGDGGDHAQGLVAVPPGAYEESVCLFPHGGAEVRLSGLRWHDARREALTTFGRRDTHEAFICGGAPEVRQQIPGAVYERCVLCGRETDVPLDLPIARRDCCIEGGGQLCRDCWQKLYGR